MERDSVKDFFNFIFAAILTGIITFLGIKWIVQVEQEKDIIKGRVFIEGLAYYCEMGSVSKKKLALIKEAESLKE